MFIDNTKKPETRFAIVDKDTDLIVNKLLKNERLKRLLYYTTPDALTKPNLTQEQTLSLLNKNIRFTPKIKVEPEVLNYIRLRFSGFTKGSQNDYFRNNIIEVDVLCNYDQWQLNDMQLRPYKIASEIDLMLNDARLTGIGKLEFLGATEINHHEIMGGVCLTYRSTYSNEDKTNGVPGQEERLEDDFNYIWGEL